MGHCLTLRHQCLDTDRCLHHMLTYISYMVCDGDMCVDTPWRGHLATSSSEDMLRRENWSNNGKSPRKQRRWWCRARFIFWRSDQTQSAEFASVSVFYLLNNTALQQAINKEQKTPVSVCVCFVLFSDSSDFTTVWKRIWPVCILTNVEVAII